LKKILNYKKIGGVKQADSAQSGLKICAGGLNFWNTFCFYFVYSLFRLKSVCKPYSLRRDVYQFNEKGESKMLAKQVSRDKEIYCTAEMPLTEVFNKMTELGCVCMPVVESPAHRNIIGTITEHDICQKIINGGLNPQRASAGRVMNGHFTTVGSDATVEECAELLRLAGAVRLFMVDENGAFMGVLTEKDLVSARAKVNRENVVKDFQVPSPLPQKVQLAH
jgi:predicted transcriptional regulator